ncbi:MAG: hypothetical protein Q7T26_01295 [Dehalococcoidia bacterium]|nr:hypothetical protein [Dehalococcoidia bacterium]
MKWVQGLTLGASAALLILTTAACQVAVAAAHPKAADTPANAKPKRLETIVEIHMYDNYFADVNGQQNPTFKVSAGKTVGIHIHNEGKAEHELVVGRKVHMEEQEISGKKVAVPDGYETNLFEMVEADVFFYNQGVKAEVGGAKFGELEFESGVKDAWIRVKIPETAKGTWEIGCFAPGHYEAGMKTTLIVE